MTIADIRSKSAVELWEAAMCAHYSCADRNRRGKERDDMKLYRHGESPLLVAQCICVK